MCRVGLTRSELIQTNRSGIEDPGQTVGDLLRPLAARVPERVALVDGADGRRWTYAELWADSGRLAAGYLHVEQDDVRALARGGRHRGRAVARLADHVHVVLRLQDPAQPLADEHVVVDDQDPRAVVTGQLGFILYLAGDRRQG